LTNFFTQFSSSSSSSFSCCARSNASYVFIAKEKKRKFDLNFVFVQCFFSRGRRKKDVFVLQMDIAASNRRIKERVAPSVMTIRNGNGISMRLITFVLEDE
jgi:hypothetical protein